MLASPLMAFYVLRLRPMASFRIPDPALETAFIFHPADVFARYQALLQPTQRLREGARVGFLVPARLDYLVFGALPGYFVTRYLFALIAVVPAYLLLRKLYGRSAGALGAIVVLSSPVIITAWGSDYTDSAVVSYLAGALACLAMPCSDRRRPIWVFLGGGLLTMAIWSHLNAVPLAGTTVAVYLLVWLARGRGHVLKDLAVLAGAALVVTGLLSIASELELGHFNFIGPTWDAYRLLSQSSSVLRDHSSNWRWVLYDSYLLVPPAVVLAWAVTFGRRLRAVPTPQLFAGLACAGQVFAFFALQFAGGVQTLELFYLSSPLWGAVCLTVAITMAELSRPLLSRPVARFLPPALLLVVPLGYEILPHVAPFGWSPVGLALALSLVVVCAAGVQLVHRSSSAATLTATGLSVLLAAALVLVLTVAPVPKHIRRPGELLQPPAPYAAALGGSAEKAVHAYQNLERGAGVRRERLTGRRGADDVVGPESVRRPPSHGRPLPCRPHVAPLASAQALPLRAGQAEQVSTCAAARAHDKELGECARTAGPLAVPPVCCARHGVSQQAPCRCTLCSCPSVASRARPTGSGPDGELLRRLGSSSATRRGSTSPPARRG